MSNQKNLEQKRAAHAWNACEKEDKFHTENKADVTKKITTMAQDCGILPALAFALENSDEAYKKVFAVFAGYRKDIPEEDPKDFMEDLIKMDSAALRLVTRECLAYFSFLRRFANIKSTKGSLNEP